MGPSDFYERDFDKKFTLLKWLMPHLHNMVCLANFSFSKNADQVSKQFKDLKLSQSDVKKILFSNLPTEPSDSNPKKDSFVFLQFHHHDPMGELIRKHKSGENGIQVY